MDDNNTLEGRIDIIEHAELEDAMIMDEAYTQLIVDTIEDENKQEYIILRSTTQKRIKELVN